MLKQCKKIAQSGEVEHVKIRRGKEVRTNLTIFGRNDDGSPRWVGEVKSQSRPVVENKKYKEV